MEPLKITCDAVITKISFRYYRVPDSMYSFLFPKEGLPKKSMLKPFRHGTAYLANNYFREGVYGKGGKTICKVTVHVGNACDAEFEGVAICKMEDNFVNDIARGEALEDALKQVGKFYPAFFVCYHKDWCTFDEYYPKPLTPREIATLPYASNEPDGYLREMPNASR